MKLSFVKTVLTTSPEEAAGFIKQGRVAAFPTETVYGLGANVFDEKAIARIFEAKQRPADNPLIAHIGDIAQIGELTAGTSSTARKFIERFFPGPLTHRSAQKQKCAADRHRRSRYDRRADAGE